MSNLIICRCCFEDVIPMDNDDCPKCGGNAREGDERTRDVEEPKEEVHTKNELATDSSSKIKNDRLEQFFRTTWEVWRSGMLDQVSPGLRESVSDLYNKDFIEPWHSEFFEIYTPNPGEFLIGADRWKQIPAMVLTNKRLWLLKKKPLKIVEFENRDIKQFRLRSGAFAGSITIRHHDGTESTLENVPLLPTSEAIHFAVGQGSTAKGVAVHSEDGSIILGESTEASCHENAKPSLKTQELTGIPCPNCSGKNLHIWHSIKWAFIAICILFPPIGFLLLITVEGGKFSGLYGRCPDCNVSGDWGS